MKTSLLFRLAFRTRSNKSRNKYFYEALGASSSDVALLSFLKFLKFFLPLVLVLALLAFLFRAQLLDLLASVLPR